MRDQKFLITPLMTDEEAQQIARRTILACEALGLLALIIVCVAAWVAIPA